MNLMIEKVSILDFENKEYVVSIKSALSEVIEAN